TPRTPGPPLFPSTTLFRSLAEGLAQGVVLGRELGEPAAHGLHLRLEVEDPLDAGQADALVGQPLDLAQPVDVPGGVASAAAPGRSEEHTSELQSREKLVCR